VKATQPADATHPFVSGHGAPVSVETIHSSGHDGLLNDGAADYLRELRTADANNPSATMADLADRAADLLEATARYYRARARAWRPAAPQTTTTTEYITGEEC
jgi:hypothetical protein